MTTFGIANPRKTVPFQENLSMETFNFTNLGSLLKDEHDEPDFWHHELIFAYQPGESKDRDPNDEEYDLGKTPKTLGIYSRGWSVIFLESIREESINAKTQLEIDTQGPAMWWAYHNLLFAIGAHELGHGPGRQLESTDHAEEGLMRQYPWNWNFAPQSIRRFRKAKSWGN